MGGQRVTAVACVPTSLQKQQAVAAFTVSGTMARARPLIATLWGVDVAQVPDDAALREWIADASVVPEKEHMALAERLAQAMHRASLLDLEADVIKACKEKVRPGSEKFFTLLGALKIIGARVDPMVAAKTTVYDLRGARFKTSRNRSKTLEGAAIEGDFVEVNSDGD